MGIAHPSQTPVNRIGSPTINVRDAVHHAATYLSRLHGWCHLQWTSADPLLQQLSSHVFLLLLLRFQTWEGGLHVIVESLYPFFSRFFAVNTHCHCDLS